MKGIIPGLLLAVLIIAALLCGLLSPACGAAGEEHLVHPAHTSRVVIRKAVSAYDR